VQIRDNVAGLPQRLWWNELTPVQRQLLGHCDGAATGAGSGDHAWGHHPQAVPLYRELAGRGLLDANYPPLTP